MILVMGAKGGVGTTRTALELIRTGNAIAVDLADGRLAAQLERATLHLATLGYASAFEQRLMVDEIIRKGTPLIWTETSPLVSAKIWPALSAIALRRPVVIDGGLEPPIDLKPWLQQVIIVSAATDLARQHEQHLVQIFPHAIVIDGTHIDVSRALALQLFQSIH
jgi:hypothetical protein